MITILDFDGTLTAEEEQVAALRDLSLDTLANELLGVGHARLNALYIETRARIVNTPGRYTWDVNGLVASYADEGAFILNTTTVQTMLRGDADLLARTRQAFPCPEYDAVVDCSNYLFHRHTAELPVTWKPGARQLLAALQHHPPTTPSVLTNSLGDKVARHLAALALDAPIEILGDTRQYEMDPDWQCPLGKTWQADEAHPIDLRRPAYHRALLAALSRDERVIVVADTLSLPGSLPLMMGIPFYLIATPYTPTWARRVVEAHHGGTIIESLPQLQALLIPEPGQRCAATDTNSG